MTGFKFQNQILSHLKVAEHLQARRLTIPRTSFPLFHITVSSCFNGSAISSDCYLHYFKLSKISFLYRRIYVILINHHKLQLCDLRWILFEIQPAAWPEQNLQAHLMALEAGTGNYNVINKVLQWCSWQTSTCPHIVMTAKNHQFFDHTLIKIHQYHDDQPAKLGEVERSVQGNVSVDPCRGLLVCTWVKIDHSICLHLRHFSSCSIQESLLNPPSVCKGVVKLGHVGGKQLDIVEVAWVFQQCHVPV